MNITTNQNAPELIADLQRQNVRLSVVGGDNLHVKDEMTEMQRRAVRQMKSQIINAIRTETEKDSSFEARAVSQRLQLAKSISQKLNAMIEAGASFDVAEDSFVVIGDDKLTEDQKQYLIAGERSALCTLQQALLVKHLPESSISEYVFEVRKRAEMPEVSFEDVFDVTGEWFANLLDLMSDKGAGL